MRFENWHVSLRPTDKQHKFMPVKNRVKSNSGNFTYRFEVFLQQQLEIMKREA
jgi:hypothetical protein